MLTTCEKCCIDRRVGPCNILQITTVAMILLGVAAVVAIIAVNPVPTTGRTAASVSKLFETEDCIDVAVIGGGIGGSYTGWRLRDKRLAISAYEYTDRVGGRLFTKDLPVAPGTYLDFGGMRFRRGAHPILTRTSTEVGLNIIPFELGYGNADETIWYARSKRMRNTDLGTNQVPFNIDLIEKKDPDSLIWDLVQNNLNLSSNTYPSLDEMYALTTDDGTPLYNMTIDNFYGRYASREAYNYIHDTSGWADSVGTQGALHLTKLYTVYPGDTGASEPYSTIEGGMERLPQTLMRKFLDESSSHKLYLNHQLMKIERRPEGGYTLTFRRTQTVDGITTPIKNSELQVCTQKVVLAAQKKCIENIEFSVFNTNPDIMETLDSVIDYPAGRIYLAYENKWWKTNNTDITHTKSDLPNRQTYDWSTGTNNVSVLMASYNDGGMTGYWRELSRFGSQIPGSLPGANAVTDVVKNRLEKYLSLIYDVKQEDIPPAVGGGMMLWDTYPYNAAWSYFKAGVDEREVREKVYRPSPSDNVYIVGNSWSADDLQGWSEGTLVAVDHVMQKYFN